MGSAKGKGEYLAVERDWIKKFFFNSKVFWSPVETALNATGEKTEEESTDQKDLWMFCRLFRICGRSFAILFFGQIFVFTENGHWESGNNCKDKVTFLKLHVSFYPSLGIQWQEEYGWQNI